MYISNFINSLNNKKIKVVGFDFFDTVVSRRVQVPTDIFSYLGEHLLSIKAFSSYIQSDRFKKIRIDAEIAARTKSNNSEVNLLEIYKEFPEKFFNRSLEEIVKKEIEVEDKFLFPNNDIIQAIYAATVKNKIIAIVSDTYMGRTELLFFISKFIPDIKLEIFTSSEYRTGKSQNLFQNLFQKFKIDPHEYIHIGDNYHADVEKPISLGSNAFFYNNGTTRAWEIIFKENQLRVTELNTPKFLKHGDYGVTALRLKLNSGNPYADTLTHRMYGHEILGPLLTCFTDWVRAELIENKIEIALPLMREGYLIGKLLSKYNEIELKDAYLSRRVLYQASLTKISEDSLRNLRFTNLKSTVSQYLELICLHPEDVPELKPKLSLNIKDENTFNNVIQIILKNKNLKNIILKRVGEIRAGVIKHIKNICSINGELVNKVALIDVGWNGTIQKLLAQILREENIDISILGLYMMTTPAVDTLALEGSLAKGFYIESGMPSEQYQPLIKALEILEQSCSPAHGSVLKHSLIDGSPVLSLDRIPKSQREEIFELQTGIIDFQQQYLVHLDKNRDSSTLKYMGQYLMPILLRAMLWPTIDETYLFKNWVHDDNLGSGGILPILGNEDWRLCSKYKTINRIWSDADEGPYWKSGALAIHEPSRINLLATTVVKNIRLDAFEQNLNLSSQLLLSSSDSFDKHEFQAVYNSPIIRNEIGLTYLIFDFSLEKKVAIKWIPVQQPFELTLDFIVFTYRSKSGKIFQHRTQGNSEFFNIVNNININLVSHNTWRSTKDDGGYFLFKDLHTLGITDEGTLKIEIAIKFIELIDPNEGNLGVEFDQFSLNRDTSIVEGFCTIDTFNNKTLTKQETFISKNSMLSLSGWMAEPNQKIFKGDFFMRLINPIGKTQFIPLSPIDRPDVAEFLDNQDAVNTGFFVNNLMISPGEYVMNILRKNIDHYTISSNSWKVIIS